MRLMEGSTAVVQLMARIKVTFDGQAPGHVSHRRIDLTGHGAQRHTATSAIEARRTKRRIGHGRRETCC